MSHVLAAAALAVPVVLTFWRMSRRRVVVPVAPPEKAAPRTMVTSSKAPAVRKAPATPSTTVQRRHLLEGDMDQAPRSDPTADVIAQMNGPGICTPR